MEVTNKYTVFSNESNFSYPLYRNYIKGVNVDRNFKDITLMNSFTATGEIIRFLYTVFNYKKKLFILCFFLVFSI